MAGQRARALNGTFNNVPVLHSNQPEIVKGPGILVNTAPGSATAAENNQPLKNAEFTFNGEFGLHMHHKYYPQDSSKLGGRRARGLLTVAAIAINPGNSPITHHLLRFQDFLAVPPLSQPQEQFLQSPLWGSLLVLYLFVTYQIPYHT